MRYSHPRPAICAVLLLPLLLLVPVPADCWPGGHRTLRCADCHSAAAALAAPADPQLPPGVAACLRCHTALRHRQGSRAAVLFAHAAWGRLGPDMVQRLQEADRPSLPGAAAAAREASFSCGTCHPPLRHFPAQRPSLDPGALCTRCHGGALNPGAPGQPRLLYTGPGAPPSVGADAAPALVQLPVAVFRNFHANPRSLGYVLELDLGSDGVLDRQEYVQGSPAAAPPMRWGTPHELAAFLWPPGRHRLELIPWDRHGPAAGRGLPLELDGPRDGRIRESLAVGLECGGRLWDGFLGRWEDDAGTVLRLYCLDGGSFVDEFALFAGSAAERGRQVARCSGVEGDNAGLLVHSGDGDGTGRPDRLLGIFWRSERTVWASLTETTREWKTFEFDVAGGTLLLKRYLSADGPGGAEPDWLREEARNLDPMEFEWSNPLPEPPAQRPEPPNIPADGP